MTTFLRLLADKDKATNLLASCLALRKGNGDARVFQVAPESFRAVPGAPFAYWVSSKVLTTFLNLPPLESNGRTAQHGGSTKDDFRFIRACWEVDIANRSSWVPLAKGGAYSLFYADVYLVVNWRDDARELEAALLHKYPYLGESANWVLHRECSYGVPGITWPSRTISGLGMRILPAGCIFSSKGPAAFADDGHSLKTLALLAIVVSTAFRHLVSLQMASVSFEVGVIQQTPVPILSPSQQDTLATLARRAWSLKRTLDTIEETSHAFVLPAALRERLRDFNPHAIEAELTRIQSEIDTISFDLYGFSDADRAAVQTSQGAASESDPETSADHDGDDDDSAAPIDQTAGLLSWAVGVVFGRLDWRLATGERAPPAEPDPFDPLPAKSSGILPDGATAFHAHAGVLVDDQGNPHDIPLLIEEVLTRVAVTVPDDVRRWLQRDFFSFHLQLYSKSRRKAPIYWPLSTNSGGYTLWVYYPSLSSQALYTANNDFIEPKIQQVGADVTALRNKGVARTRDDEKQFEALQAFELELIELHDTLLKIASTYKPNHDDGVQISASPLWPLFRHKPWQKVLKDTWAKLEKGDYDWAHLAMNYWPERVREKCKTDKSLAIAHGLDHLFVESVAQLKKTGKKKMTGGDE